MSFDEKRVIGKPVVELRPLQTDASDGEIAALENGQKAETCGEASDYGKRVPFLIQTDHVIDTDLGGEPDVYPTCVDVHPQCRLHTGEGQINDVRLDCGDVQKKRNEDEQKEYAPDDASEPCQYTPQDRAFFLTPGLLIWRQRSVSFSLRSNCFFFRFLFHPFGSVSTSSRFFSAPSFRLCQKCTSTAKVPKFRTYQGNRFARTRVGARHGPG